MNSTVYEMRKDYFEITKEKSFEITPKKTDDLYQLIQSSSNQQHMCFIANYPLPFICPWDPNKMVFQPLGPINKCTELPTCFEIAYDSSYLVTGYASGNIFVFNPKQTQWVAIIDRSKRDDGNVAPLTRVTFAQDYQSIIACDRIGNIIQITRFAEFNPKEISLYEGRMPLTNVFMPTTDSSFLLFSDSNSVNILNTATHEFADISSSPLGETIRFDAKVNSDKSVLLITWNGTLFSMFKVESYTKIITLFEYNFDVEIKECIIRKNFVVSIVFTDGSIDLVIGTNNPRIERYYTENLRKIVKIYSIWTKSHETLFFLTPKAMYRVKFIEWAERLEKLAKANEWNTCYSMAEGIYTGNNLQVFGVEPEAAKRCLQLQNKMKDIFKIAINGAGDNQALIAQTFDCAVACDMPEFIIDTAYHIYKEDNHVQLFYNIIFTKMRRNITQCIPFEFYEEYLSLYQKDDEYTLQVIIPNVMRRGIPRQYAPKLIKLAKEIDSEPLLLRLWTECFDDYISPCNYLLASPNIIPYMSDIFLTNKFKILTIHKKLITLFFCTPNNGSYGRLLKLFSKDNWQSAPKFVKAFEDLLPIKLRNDDIFADKEFCDSIVRVSLNRPVVSNPVLDVVAELIVKCQYEFPYNSIEMMVNWAFTTNKTKTSIRESIIMMIHDQYPNVIVYKDIVDYCEAAGFARIVNTIYLPPQLYDHVIQTMALSEEWQPLIFTYINNPFKDPLKEAERERLEKENQDSQNQPEEEEEEEEFSEDEDIPKEPEKTKFQKFRDKVVETGEGALSSVKENLTPEEMRKNLNKTFGKNEVQADLEHPVITVAPVSKAMMNEIGYNDELEEEKKRQETATMEDKQSDPDEIALDFSLSDSNEDKKDKEEEEEEEEDKAEKKEKKPVKDEALSSEDSEKEDDQGIVQPKVQVIISKPDDKSDDEYSDSEKEEKAKPASKTKNAPIITFQPEDPDEEKDAPVLKHQKKEPLASTDAFRSGDEDETETGESTQGPPHPKFNLRKNFNQQLDKVGKSQMQSLFRRLSTTIDMSKSPEFIKNYEEAEETYEVRKDEKMQEAIRNNLPLLVLIDSDKTVELMRKQMPKNYNDEFIRKEQNQYVKFLYLRSAAASPECSKMLTEENQFELFELTCKFSPPDVLPMLKSSQTIEIDKALPTCTKNRVIDACIYIHTMLGDMQSAVNLVAEELEADLVDAIQSGKEIKAPSIDLVKEEPELKKAYDTVVITFDLLSKAPNQLSDRMWKDIFLAFQLPLWLVQQSKDENLQTSICYFFAFFIVETLQQNRSSPENIFNTYELQFKEINQMLYRKSLSAVFKYLDYNQKLSETVIQLLMEDCINLYGKAQRTKTRAAFIYRINCAKCNTPITGARGVGALVYECGHCYHDDSKCGMHLPFCQICKGQLANKAKDTGPPPTASDRAQNQLLRKLQRVDYGLRRHYGKDQEQSESGNAVFFFADYPVQAKQYLILNPIEKFPEQKDIFIEL